MEDKTGTGHKPLRQSSNKIKDLFNAYVRNEGSKTVPITINNPTGDEIPVQEETLGTETEANPTEDDFILVKKDDLENLLKKNEELENEKDELKDQNLRKVAEMENLRRRTLLEKQQLIDYGNERLISRFLSVVDDFAIAIESAKKTDDSSSILTGLEMIYQKTLKFLEESNVKQMESHVGKPFDVHLMEAIMVMPSEMPEGHVVQEVQAGFMIGDKVLRHSKVITSNGIAPQN